MSPLLTVLCICIATPPIISSLQAEMNAKERICQSGTHYYDSVEAVNFSPSKNTHRKSQTILSLDASGELIGFYSFAMTLA